jgi:hypothetical protein
MIKEFGEYCLNCGHTPDRGSSYRFSLADGSGQWRNLAPLCGRCHGLAHKIKSYADQLREDREALYGKWFWADKYTLFKEGLIPNTTDDAYERFMVQQEKDNKSPV